jgi:hypothetical protein
MKINIALWLSIAALASVVNAQAPKTIKGSDKNGFPTLIKIVMETGVDDKIGSNLAPVIGLPKAMPMKLRNILVPGTKKDKDTRSFLVIIDEDKHPFCVYMVRMKTSGRDQTAQYLRINLEGKLEKTVSSQGKLDENGKAIKGSGVKFEQDIDSPEVKKAFDAEMSYWLKDWLKREQKIDGKSSR